MKKSLAKHAIKHVFRVANLPVPIHAANASSSAVDAVNDRHADDTTNVANRIIMNFNSVLTLSAGFCIFGSKYRLYQSKYDKYPAMNILKPCPIHWIKISRSKPSETSE